MSKTLRYVDEFIFPSSAGFSGSSTGRDDARDQPLTPEQQGLEFGLKGNFDGGDDGTYVSKLARGGQPKRIAAPRRPKMLQAPGPSPAPAMSPMAQALATPGSPMNAPGSATSMAGQPPVQPDGMASGGRMRKASGGSVNDDDGMYGLMVRDPLTGKLRGSTVSRDKQPGKNADDGIGKAKGGRACYDGGGGVDSFDSSRDRPMTTSYSDAPASRAVDPAYTEESPRGRFPAGAPKKPVQRAAARPLPRPPAYEPPPRTGTVSVDVRARPAAAERSFRPGDAYTDPMLPTTTSYAKGGHFIQGAIKHPGALHRELGVPQGEKIPAAKLKAAAHSENPTLRHRAQFAETLKGLSHKRG